MRRGRVLLTGATGFVGSHIYRTLVAHGFDVVCGSRNPDVARIEAPDREFCHIDLSDRASVDLALLGIDRAVYLVHSMAGGDTAYETTEARNARTFRESAERNGLTRIVYLGGMRPRGRLSRHLASRLRTGRTLREGAVPVAELQATMIIGGGSESFRIVRDLAARLPWMLLPKWLKSLSEPVAIADIAAAIAFALEMPLASSCVFSVPGPEALSGREILVRTAKALGRAPTMIDIPLVTPRLSSYWIRLVTRANPHLAAELVEGLRSNIVARGPAIWELMPDYRQTSFDDAVRSALKEEERELSESTRWVERLLHRLTRQSSRPKRSLASRA